MFRLLRERSAARVPPWVLCAAISLWVFAPFASAESLPASVRSCTAENDPGRRLACFDEAVARFAETPLPNDARRAAVAAEAHPTQKSNAVPDSAKQDRSAPTAESKQAQQSSVPKEPLHLTARVVSIEYPRGEMVLHLDNGQVWEQVQEATADMNLRPGDTVTIDKGMLGSYWLGARSAGVVKIRQKQ